MNECNIGWSDTHLAALREVILRRGEVVSISSDPDVRLRYKRWTLATYRQKVWGRSWQITEPEQACGQCAQCSELTAETVQRTAANLKYIETETAHIIEDNLMIRALRQCASGEPNADELADAVITMVTTKRTRWYA